MKNNALLILFVLPLFMTVTSVASNYEKELQIIKQDIEKKNQALKVMRQAIEEDQLEELSFLSKYDFNTRQIIEYVSNNINFESYKGVLRGTKGTLVTGAGNALDQSFFLALILADIGYDVRIQNGYLNQQDANKLLLSMFDRQPLDQAINKDIFINGLKMLNKQSAADKKLVDAIKDPYKTTPELQTQAAEISRELTSVLQSTSDWKSKIPVNKELLKEVSDYYWVEYRMGPQDDWHPAHPAFRTGQWPETLPEVKNTILSEIPGNLQHRIRIEWLVDIYEQGKIKTQGLMQAYERPAANLFGVPQTFVLVPSQTGAKEKLLQSKYFIPYFNNALPSRAKAFTKTGGLVDPKDLNDSMGSADFFATFDESARKGLGAFANIGEKSKSGYRELARVYLQVTLISPDKKTKKVERHYLLNRVIEDKKKIELMPMPDSEQLVSQLTGVVTLLTGVGEQKFAMPMSKLLDDMIGMKAIYELSARKFKWPDKSVTLPLEYIGEQPAYWPAFRLYMAQLMRTESKPDQISYRDAPMVVLHKSGSNYLMKTEMIIDILSNPVRSYVKDNKKVVHVLTNNIRQGVADTLNEKTFLNNYAKNAANMGSEVLKNAVLVRTEQDLGKLDLTDKKLMGYLKSDLKQGFALIVPEQKTLKYSMWWRVNLKTGNTLGMIENGLGGLVERLGTYEISSTLTNALGLGSMAASCAQSGIFTCSCAVSVASMGIGFGAGKVFTEGFELLMTSVILDAMPAAISVAGKGPNPCK